MIRSKAYEIRVSYPSDFVNLMEEYYSKYGEDVFSIQGIANKHLDLHAFSKSFFGKSGKVSNASIDGNGNVSEKTMVQYNHESKKPYAKLNSYYLLYKWVKELFDAETAAEALEKAINGEIFINDFINFHLAYCYAFDLRILLTEGMSFFGGNFKINPPKRSDSFIALLIQSTAYISNMIMGAASYPDFFVILDYFYRKEMGEGYISDHVNRKKITEQFQNLVYSFNFPFRGNESAFTNLSVMDRGFMNKLFDGYVLPDFTLPNIESTLELSKYFFEYYESINAVEGIFTFPVMTVALATDENGEYMDVETAQWCAGVNAKKGLANIYQSTPNSFSSCCRMRSEYKEKEYNNSFGVGGLSVGSHRVVGLNMPRIAELEKNDPDIFKKDVELCGKILWAHRKIIEHYVELGNYPLYTTGWIHLSRQNSTVGFIGAYEYVRNSGFEMTSDEGQKFLFDKLNYINERTEEWATTYEGSRWNVEQIPGEGMAVKLAKIDKILGFNDKWELYSNQYIPLIDDANFVERLQIQGKFDQSTSGGAICHVNHYDPKPLSESQMWHIMETARKTGTVYFAINYQFNICENDHYYGGRVDQCPICGGKQKEAWTRVVGFNTPVSAWNEMRRDYEFERRTSINLSDVE